ncbi:MAG: cell division/cell wall cluster transcriptional repressor MraZ [Dehalococcoidia bacterium]|jgi:MraZ protein|uniref:Transcriptional regulator MraZ n=1 Tax=Tepidiforma bonchosmolovskayae TaxID=2601677 RepID=A0ABX6BYR9_9CHLR|nr:MULTISPECIES: cell division/cell wall cluster transcriptional repressor MraZ [Tepidiforma]MCL6645450.1 cell division/cell wall cluster transcriptional repressor MraZ [Dehalococcoidia bacterium]QFG02114.1 cell division/cell wall cluster transcriptional repressor MraZ [Tepidiforma bonchosmolovskayae]GIW15995.1 MAG: transcriptional regulator MraZ [Tepidiforma sp.]
MLTRFSGAYDYTLDDRGRVPIPPAFRDALKAGAYIGAGADECIHVYTLEEFERQAAIFDALPEGDPIAEDARRDFYSTFWPVQLDGQGRVNLRDDLAARAGISQSAREVKVVGVGRRIEIWNAAAYEEREASRKRARAEIAASGFAAAAASSGGGA